MGPPKEEKVDCLSSGAPPAEWTAIAESPCSLGRHCPPSTDFRRDRKRNNGSALPGGSCAGHVRRRKSRDDWRLEPGLSLGEASGAQTLTPVDVYRRTQARRDRRGRLPKAIAYGRDES